MTERSEAMHWTTGRKAEPGPRPDDHAAPGLVGLVKTGTACSAPHRL